MDAELPPDDAAQKNLERVMEIFERVGRMKLQFILCHDFLAHNTHTLITLLQEAESRGVLLEEAVTLVDAAHWLHVIEWQTKFIAMVLNFTREPSRKTLRPLIELYGRERERMKVEAEILEQQMAARIAKFATPNDAAVRKAMEKNEQRVLAAYLHVRSGFRGADLARFFGVPRTTVYGWFEWFKDLPEGLRNGILAYMDSQAQSMAACQMPAVLSKAPVSTEPEPTAAPPQADTPSEDVPRGVRPYRAWSA